MKYKAKNTIKSLAVWLLLISLVFGLSACAEKKVVVEPATIIESTDANISTPVQTEPPAPSPEAEQQASSGTGFNLADVPAYTTEPYVTINNNVPYFSADEITAVSFEEYPPLDNLGRCRPCTASVGTDLMPTEKRGDISSVKPSGYKNKPYDFVDQEYVYNRCHLIAYMLAGENDNERNLITGTRYLNTQGMLPFEEKVSDYVKNTGNHVMYRVTPIFEGDNLVASGVLMEAYSVEDNGSGLQYNVYCYNVQPGVEINYATGENWLANVEGEVETFIVNTNSNKFHLPNCDNAANISEKNKKVVESTYQMLMKQGYSPCGQCLGNRS